MQLVGLSIQPGAPGSESTLWGTVELGAPAGASGAVVRLTSDRPELASIQPELLLEPGATAAQFRIDITPGPDPAPVTITARSNETVLSTIVIVSAAPVAIASREVDLVPAPTAAELAGSAVPQPALELASPAARQPTLEPANPDPLQPASPSTNGTVRPPAVVAESQDRVGSGVEPRPGRLEWLHGLVAGLVISGPVAPTLAAIIAVGAYLSPIDGLQHLAPVGAATLYLVLAWLIFALLVWMLGFTTPDRASMGTYGELMANVQEVTSWVKWLKQQTLPPRSGMSYASWQVARNEVFDQASAIDRERQVRGARWVLATGYMTLWRRSHRAQEALVDVAPPEALVKYAQYDLLRSNNASMVDSATYASLLSAAIDVLSQGRHVDASLDKLIGDLTGLMGAITMTGQPSPETARTLNAQSAAIAAELRTLPTSFNIAQLADTLANAAGKFGDTTLDVDALRKELLPALSFLTALSNGASPVANRSAAPSGLTPPRSVAEATALIRTIRRAINDFRDESRAGLIRARNQMLATTGITAITMYALLWVALLANAPTTAIIAAISYYLVGATVGLFTRLYAEANSETGVDDFGLSLTRLLAAPLLSGLAGVLGIVLLGMAAATQYQQQTGALAAAFDLFKTPLNLVTAGVFGLTPGLLIDHLTQKTDQYKQDLKSSQPTTSTSK